MKDLTAQPLSDARHRSLVVLLHAYRHTPDRLRTVEKAVGECVLNAHVIVPALPLGMWSTVDLNDVAAALVALIDAQVTHRHSLGLGEFEQIILVGHSTGSMIARKAYVMAWGETTDAPFEHRDRFSTKSLHPGRPWARQVTRIIQLAGMNGGWSVSHHMGTRRAIEFSLGSLAGHLVESVTGRQLAIFQIRRGAAFLTGLRLQWLALQRRATEEGRPMAIVVQLLGTVDDLVAPEDNLDLVTGREFVYLDVRLSGHLNVIEMDSPTAGAARREAFELALTGSLAELKDSSVEPSDHDVTVTSKAANFTDVVFVIHGIRDAGFWTHKIARTVQALGKKRKDPKKRKVFATATSTYGYFPMLSFLLPWRRRDKVAWLMDQYARAKSLYPKATFSFLGHSNGTYLLASALRDNPACRFERVVFAGSVVRRDYDWAQAMRRGQVGTVLNYVATNDKVVACFPGALEQLRWDLGSAGHNGFVQPQEAPKDFRLFQVRFVEGGHSAALSEEHWKAIARFVCCGRIPPRPQNGVTQRRSALFLGKYPWILWAAILALLSAVTLGIWQIPFEWLRTLALLGFSWVVMKILTRF